MSHPNEPTLKRLLEIRTELVSAHDKGFEYSRQKLAINSQIRRKEKEPTQ